MAHADPEEEPAGIGVGEHPPAVRHSDRIACPHVGDARRDDRPLGRCEEPTGVTERLAGLHSLAKPYGAVTERFDLRRGVALLSRRLRLEREAPHADPAERSAERVALPPKLEVGGFLHGGRTLSGCFAQSDRSERALPVGTAGPVRLNALSGPRPPSPAPRWAPT